MYFYTIFPSLIHLRVPFLFLPLFSHCSPVQAFICNACISSNNPFSFKWFCTSRCRLINDIPSNVLDTIVNSSLAPHPSDKSMIVYSSAFGYCIWTCMKHSYTYDVRRCTKKSMAKQNNSIWIFTSSYFLLCAPFVCLPHLSLDLQGLGPSRAWGDFVFVDAALGIHGEPDLGGWVGLGLGLGPGLRL